MPQRSVRGAAKFEITAFIDFLIHRVPQIVIFNPVGLRQKKLIPEGCLKPKKVETAKTKLLLSLFYRDWSYENQDGELQKFISRKESNLLLPF